MPTSTVVAFNGSIGALAPLYGAFCDIRQLQFARNHPVDPPDDVFAPWVWEAVHRDAAHDRHVQLSVVPRMACSFNATRWHASVREFPRYAAQMANGRATRRLVAPLSLALADRERALAAAVHLQRHRNATYTPGSSVLRQLRLEVRALRRYVRAPQGSWSTQLT